MLFLFFVHFILENVFEIFQFWICEVSLDFEFANENAFLLNRRKQLLSYCLNLCHLFPSISIELYATRNALKNFWIKETLIWIRCYFFLFFSTKKQKWKKTLLHLLSKRLAKKNINCSLHKWEINEL